MSDLQRHVHAARRRLWLNRWVAMFGWCLCAAGAAWLLLVVAVRVCGLDWPLANIGLGGLGAALLASIIWLMLRHESPREAALAFDAAAGLKERLSTSLFCADSADEFSAAVVADARSRVAGLSARRLIPLRWTAPLNYGLATTCLALLVFFLLPAYDLLGRNAQREDQQRRNAARDTMREVLSKPVEAIEQIAEKHPDLNADKGLSELAEMMKADRADIPADKMRIEAIKKLDRMADQLRNKLADDKFEALDALKQMMQQLGQNASKASVTSPLLDSLQQQDFKAAKQQIEAMKEQLAKREHGAGDAAKVAEMQKQLEQLSDQLNQLKSGNEKNEQKLKDSGLSEQDVKRVLDALAKKDKRQLEQIAKELEEKLKQQGMTAEQAKQMAQKAQQAIKQMQKNQDAQQQCKKMGDKLGNAAKSMQEGKDKQASSELSDAAEQLSDLEMAAEEMNELQAQTAEMDEMKDDLSDKCSDCAGKGCKSCNGTGRCNGGGKGDGDHWGEKEGRGDWGKGAGRAYGLRERAKDGKVDFVRKKAKTPVGKGSVIGVQYIKGEMLRGEAKAELIEATEAAERDATDALNSDRVPRSYHKAVKTYFDRFGQLDRPTAAKSVPPANKAAPNTP